VERVQKEKIVEQLQKKLEESTLAIVTEYNRLTVAQMTAFRSELRRSQGEYLIVKNTLARLAIEGSRYSSIKPLLRGTTGWVFGRGDSAPVAKLVVRYAEGMPGLSIKGGVFEGEFLDAVAVKGLSSLPSRAQIFGQLLSVIQGCGNKVVGILSEPGRRVVRVLEEVRKSRERSS
jgi:large subunit ribosomal protein L10